MLGSALSFAFGLMFLAAAVFLMTYIPYFIWREMVDGWQVEKEQLEWEEAHPGLLPRRSKLVTRLTRPRVCEWAEDEGLPRRGYLLGACYGGAGAAIFAVYAWFNWCGDLLAAMVLRFVPDIGPVYPIALWALLILYWWLAMAGPVYLYLRGTKYRFLHWGTQVLLFASACYGVATGICVDLAAACLLPASQYVPIVFG